MGSLCPELLGPTYSILESTPTSVSGLMYETSDTTSSDRASFFLYAITRDGDNHNRSKRVGAAALRIKGGKTPACLSYDKTTEEEVS